MQESLQGKHVGAEAVVWVAEAMQHSVCLVQAESEEEPCLGQHFCCTDRSLFFFGNYLQDRPVFYL